jgi:hypothetical protein
VLFRRKRDAGVDDHDVVAIANAHHVLADVARAAQRDNLQPGAPFLLRFRGEILFGRIIDIQLSVRIHKLLLGSVVVFIHAWILPRSQVN